MADERRDRALELWAGLILVRLVPGEVRPQHREQQFHQLLVLGDLRRSTAPGPELPYELRVVECVELGGRARHIWGRLRAEEQAGRRGLFSLSQRPGELEGEQSPATVPEQCERCVGRVRCDRVGEFVDQRFEAGLRRLHEAVLAPRQLHRPQLDVQRQHIRPGQERRCGGARKGETEQAMVRVGPTNSAQAGCVECERSHRPS